MNTNINNNSSTNVPQFGTLASSKASVCNWVERATVKVVARPKTKHKDLTQDKGSKLQIRSQRTKLVLFSFFSLTFSEDSQRLFAVNTHGKLVVWQRRDQIYTKPPVITVFQRGQLKLLTLQLQVVIGNSNRLVLNNFCNAGNTEFVSLCLKL